jgi:DNA-directed RNA polymerase specialized sigma24 family protein
VEVESPDYYLMERESRQTARRVAELVGRLGPAERELVQLRYERGRTAEEVARELGLAGPRAVYTMTERVLRKIRRWFEGAGVDGNDQAPDC